MSAEAVTQSTRSEPLVALRDATVVYRQHSLFSLFGLVRPFVAVHGVSLALAPGETLALVGESGSGKSTIAKAIIGLASLASGRLEYRGEDINRLLGRRNRDVKRDLQIVFQNPDASLNPRHSVGFILARAIQTFQDIDAAEARKTVAALLLDVKLDPSYAARYPRQLSGGERQRVAIARALAAEPKVLICDEILSALDVSVQAEILELLRHLRSVKDLSVLFISHDLAVVRWIADRVAVLRDGLLCEVGTTEEVFSPPHHPYTQELMDAVPEIGRPLTVG